jgi:HlyD family secretion protein
MNRSLTKKLAFAGSGVLALAVFFAGRHIFSDQQKKMPEFVIVGKSSVVQKVSAAGTLFPLRTARIYSRVPGVVAAVYVDYNSPVEKGGPLALIDTKEFEAEQAGARASLAAAEAMADKEAAAMRQAQTRLARTETLAKENAVPQNSYDEAFVQFEVEAAQKKAALAQVEQAKAALRIATIRIDESRITAPISGVVLSKTAEVGQSVEAASLRETCLFTLAADLSAMELRAEVSEADIGKISLGQKLTFSVDAFPDTVFSGAVKTVRMEPIIDQKAVSYGVIAEVDNGRLLLRPSMSSVILIETARREGVHAVPAGAIIEKNDRCYVTVPGGNGATEQREVRKGLRGYDGSVEIVSGLTDGDTVIIATKAE